MTARTSPPGYRADPSPAMILGLGFGLVIAALSWLSHDLERAELEYARVGADDQPVRPGYRGPLVDVDSLKDLVEAESAETARDDVCPCGVSPARYCASHRGMTS